MGSRECSLKFKWLLVISHMFNWGAELCGINGFLFIATGAKSRESRPVIVLQKIRYFLLCEVRNSLGICKWY